MNPQQIQRLNCDINFGLASLQNTSLRDNFYPPDLPSDWRLGFYSNEFSSLLLSLSDLDIKSALTSASISRLIELFTAMEEDAREADCVLFFDLSQLNGTESTDEMLEIALHSKLKDSRYFKLVNLETSLLGGTSEKELKANILSSAPVETVNETEIPFNISQPIPLSQDSAACDWLCLVKDENKIKPPELKVLIENIHKAVIQECSQLDFMTHRDVVDENTINIVVIFTSSQYALENCRKAILLESMMLLCGEKQRE